MVSFILRLGFLCRSLEDKSTLIFQHWHRVRIARAQRNNRWMYATARNWEHTSVWLRVEYFIRDWNSYELTLFNLQRYVVIVVAAAASSITLISFERLNAKSFISIYDLCSPQHRSIFLSSSSVELHFFNGNYLYFCFLFILIHYSGQRLEKQDNERTSCVLETEWKMNALCVCAVWVDSNFISFYRSNIFRPRNSFASKAELEVLKTRYFERGDLV